VCRGGAWFVGFGVMVQGCTTLHLTPCTRYATLQLSSRVPRAGQRPAEQRGRSRVCAKVAARVSHVVLTRESKPSAELSGLNPCVCECNGI